MLPKVIKATSFWPPHVCQITNTIKFTTLTICGYMININLLTDVRYVLSEVNKNLIPVYTFRGDVEDLYETIPVSLQSSILEKKYGLETSSCLKPSNQKAMK
jgi:hypothetical protein